MKPVIIIGGGPVGLTAALALDFYGLPVQVFEEDAALSVDAKSGTVLTRSIEAFRRYGVADAVLAGALRLDEIAEIERATDRRLRTVRTDLLADETRYPFVINMPQHHLEPVLAAALEQRQPGALRLRHRFAGFRQDGDGVTVRFETPDGVQEVAGSYLLACDGARSTVRSHLDIPVEGSSAESSYELIDFDVELTGAARDYPYLTYFADPAEWVVLVRQPHCWRFVYPLAPGAALVQPAELLEPRAALVPPAALLEKVQRFIGEAGAVTIVKSAVYRVHHRIATRWQHDRVFLLGDAAHLITPMWALGLNTGILDAIALPWRLAWVARGWAAPALLEGYAREQRPIALHGSAELVNEANAFMAGETLASAGSGEDDWNNAMTRTMLGLRLDVAETGDSAVVRTGPAQLRVGERIPDALLHGADGRPVRLHDLVDDSFVALHLCDIRGNPDVPEHRPGLRHYAVSRWDAPLASPLRDRTLFDPGGRFHTRVGCAEGTVILVRPDDHVAAIEPMQPGVVDGLLARILA